MVKGPRHESGDAPLPGTASRASGESRDFALEETLVSVFRQAQRRFFDDLMEMHGETKAVELFCQAGLLAGGELVRNFLSRSTDFRQFAAFLKNDFTGGNIGILRIKSIDPDTGSLKLSVTIGIGCAAIPAPEIRRILAYDAGFALGVFAAVEKARPGNGMHIWKLD